MIANLGVAGKTNLCTCNKELYLEPSISLSDLPGVDSLFQLVASLLHAHVPTPSLAAPFLTQPASSIQPSILISEEVTTLSLASRLANMCH